MWVFGEQEHKSNFSGIAVEIRFEAMGCSSRSRKVNAPAE